MTAALLLSACSGRSHYPSFVLADDLPTTPAPTPEDPTPPGPADETSTQRDGFQVTVHTDRDRYTSGDEVTFTVEICNLGPPTIVEEGSDSFRFTVSDDTGQPVANDSHALYTLELRRTQWQTGDCRTHTGSWDQHYWNRPDDEPTEEPDTFGLPTRGSEVPAGQYTIRISTYYGSATTDPFTLSDAVPLAIYPRTGEGSDGAALGGVLELRDGCVIVGGDDPIIPVFPDTVSWDEQAESVVYADGTRLATGERIMLGGGFVEDGVPSFADVPPGCPQGLAFFIVGTS